MTAPKASASSGCCLRRSPNLAPQHGAEPEDQRRKGPVSDDDHPLIIIAGLQDLRLGELDAITARVLEALGARGSRRRGRRRHADVSSSASISAPTGRIFGTRSAARSPRRSSTRRGEPSAGGRAAWLTLFAEVAAIAEDERIVAVIGELVASLRAEVAGGERRAPKGSASVEAVLVASSLFDPQELVPPAIDQLEHVVGGAYQPGAGVRGGLINQVRAASALLTAFEITGRLPYSMLAEELMQTARRTAPDDANPDTIVVLLRRRARVLPARDAARRRRLQEGGGDRRRTPTIAATPRASWPRNRRARSARRRRTPPPTASRFWTF